MADVADWTIPIEVVSGSSVGAGGSGDPSLLSGAIAQTFPRWEAQATSGMLPANGNLIMGAIWLNQSTKVSSIGFYCADTQFTGLTHCWFGLYDVSLNQLATTTDTTSGNWTTTTTRVLNIATTAAGSVSSFTTTYTGTHYVGLVTVASGAGTISDHVPTAFVITGLTPPVSVQGATGLTAPPAFPYQASVLATNVGMPWGWVS